MTPEEQKLSKKIASELNAGISEVLLRVLKAHTIDNSYIFYTAFEDVLLANLKASFATIASSQGIRDVGEQFSAEILKFTEDLAKYRDDIVADPSFQYLQELIKKSELNKNDRK